MSLPPITLQLTRFEQLEILRIEIDKREEELKLVEKSIRDVIYETERQHFLQTVHAVFQQLPPHEQSANLPQLHAQREVLGDAIQAMKSALAALEAETAGQHAPASRSPGLRAAAAPGAAGPAKRKFDSFDDFRSNKGPAG